MKQTIIINVDGFARQVWAIYGQRIKPKTTLDLPPQLLRPLRALHMAINNGSSARLLNLAMSSYTVTLLFSDLSLTYATDYLLLPETIIAIDTRQQLLYTAHGSVPARIQKASFKVLVNDDDSKYESLAQQLERVRQELRAVAQGNYELRQENDALLQLHAQGCFKFAMEIDGVNFRAFAAIMVLGTQRAAAAHLGIPQRTFYDRVKRWKSGKEPYKNMWRLVVWRKTMGRKIKIPLGELLQSGEAKEGAENPKTVTQTLASLSDSSCSTQRDELLRDILQALVQMNPDNWTQVQKELIEVIKEEVPQ